MCLTKLKDFRVRKTEGYKVFHVIGGKLHSLVQGTGAPIPRRRWVHEKDWNTGNRGGRVYYELGWHICTAKEGTRMWAGKTYRVKFRNVVTKGVQVDRNGEHNVIVAKEMLIMGEA